MFDLNQLFPASSNLYVISASNMNESGQIAGMAVEMAGPNAGTIVHAFLATPVDEDMGKTVADVVGTHPKITMPAANLASSFRRGPHTAQSTIKVLSELPHHAFQPCCAKAKILRLLQNIWVTRNIAVTQSVYRESYLRRASARGHRTVTVVIDLPKPSLPANVGKQFFRRLGPICSADDRIRPLPTCTLKAHAACSSLRRVSEMSHSILAGFESL